MPTGFVFLSSFPFPLTSNVLLDDEKENFGPLHAACKHNHEHIVRLLVREDAKMDRHISLVCSSFLHLSPMLLTSDRIPNDKQIEHTPVLHYAVTDCSCGMVQLLLSLGANVNAVDKVCDWEALRLRAAWSDKPTFQTE